MAMILELLFAKYSTRFSVRPPRPYLPFARNIRKQLFSGRTHTDFNLRVLVDVTMNRVKFNVNTEYAYLQNFKVLQSTS